MAKMIQCKTCKKEIASNAKNCPNCGAKNKKPFYKRVWFWIIAVIIVIGLSGGNDEQTETIENNKSQTNKQQTTAFKIGDTIELDEFKVTVNGIRTSNGSQFIKPQEGNEYLYVDATIENISDKDQPVSSMLMFKVVDKDGRSYSQAITDNANGQLDGTVGPGRKISGEYVVEVELGKTGLELQFNSSLLGNQVIVELN